MIQYNVLKITPDGKNLIVQASVKDLSYYTDVYIKEIYIDNQDTYSTTGPSDNSIYHATLEKSKSIDLEINYQLFKEPHNLNNDILYVYLVIDGAPTSDTPCGMDNEVTLGLAYNLEAIYKQGMCYFKSFAESCSTPTGFIDFILRYYALLLAIKVHNYTVANTFWNKFLNKTISVTSNTKSCGCSS